MIGSALLSVGALPDITRPEFGRHPWMLGFYELGFPVEWPMCGACVPSEVA